MIFVITATILCLATAYALRAGMLAGTPLSLTGFDGVGVIVGFIAFVLAAIALGPIFGFSLVLSLLLHEYGHVIAYRAIGHRNVRFRLVPMISGMPISDTPLRTEREAFFVALMGPGISVAPVALSYAVSVMLAGNHPETAATFRVFAVTCGTLNFINMLPFYPLDGGKCTRIFSSNFWPTLAPAFAVFMSAMFIAAAIRTGSITLFVMAGIGIQSLVHKDKSKLEKMGADAALTSMAAYSFTFAAHFCAGWWLLKQYM